MNAEVLKAAETIWDYLQLDDQAGAADCLIVLGSRDDRVATYASELADRYSYKHIVITGGIAHHNDLLATRWGESTEAEHFYTVMKQAGMVKMPLLEQKATNTGDNARLSYRLLKADGISVESIVVVTKPYMERRAKATFEKQWPGPLRNLDVTSPKASLQMYCNNDQPLDTVIHIMVGDLDRIINYPQRGYQSEQVVPGQALQALEVLKLAGYTNHAF